MLFRWLKNYMPRGIYARAALILVLPVLLLQLLVSVVFIQRHFDGVTRLMTSAVNIELRFLVATVNEAETLQEAQLAIAKLGGPLEIDTELPSGDVIAEDIVPFQDLTGDTVIAILREGLSGIQAVSLADRRRVLVWVETRHGNLKMDLSRKRVSASNPLQLLVIMVVLGALMTAIAYVFLRNQLRPIKRMARAAADYGKGRITPFTPTGAVEVRAAGMAFLDMRNRIERQSQSRTLMLSGVSHDLRTPITRLRLGLSLLEPEDREPLERDVEEMQRLIDTFLDFARGDAEGGEAEPTDPVALVRDIVDNARRGGQDVALDLVEGQGEASLRPQALRRAVENLIGNAGRYAKRCQVSVLLSGKSLRIRVEDDGPGIPPEKREDAVRPFVRLDASRNQNSGPGVGLGLAIATDIARSHGGVLRLGESQRLGGLCADIVIAR